MLFRRRRSRVLSIILLSIIMVLTVNLVSWHSLSFPETEIPQQLRPLINSGNLPNTVAVTILPLNITPGVGKEKSRMARVETENVFLPGHRKLSGYLVYDCSKQHFESCGGWADRVSGMLSTFGLAVISQRHFKVRHDMPCSLNKMLEPNAYNWTLDELKIPTNSEYKHLIDNKSYDLRTLALKTKHLENAFKSNVTFLRINWDITIDFRRRPNISEDFPWVTKLQFADIYYGFYHYLFKPSKTLLHEFDNLQKQRKHRLLACAHVRSSNQKQYIPHIWKFLSKLDRINYDVFIASDKERIRNEGISSLQGFDVITTPGILGNIDSAGHSGCEVFKSSMVDFYTLTTCDLLVITDSGFSILAAYVRGTSDHLYCMGAHDVYPCSRNVLEDVYPGNMLAPRLK